MKEKEPKSPILVVATIMFLSLFIILPPVFRKFFPEEEVVVEQEVVKTSLSCEKVAVAENMKVTTKISYENDVAMKNVMTFIVYTPTDEDIAADDGTAEGRTCKEEINFLKSLTGADVQENASQTVISFGRKIIDDNPTAIEITNYLAEINVAMSHFEAEGYICTKGN